MKSSKLSEEQIAYALRQAESGTAVADVRRRLEAWRVDYNEQRPHSALGHLTPREFSTQRQATTTGAEAA